MATTTLTKDQIFNLEIRVADDGGVPVDTAWLAEKVHALLADILVRAEVVPTHNADQV